jgi:hypothetical protein
MITQNSSIYWILLAKRQLNLDTEIHRQGKEELEGYVIRKTGWREKARDNEGRPREERKRLQARDPGEEGHV